MASGAAGGLAWERRGSCFGGRAMAVFLGWVLEGFGFEFFPISQSSVLEFVPFYPVQQTK